MEGKDNCILKPDEYHYFCKKGNKIFFPKYLYYSGYDIITMYGNLEKGRIIQFDIPLQKMEYQIIKFYLYYNEKEIEIYPSLGWFSFIPNILNGYYNSGTFIIKYNDNRMCVFMHNTKLEESFEDKYQKELKKLGKQNIIKLRQSYFKAKKKIENNETTIWIINDRKDIAGDNGEYFFRFLKKIKPKGIRFYFVIDKYCRDYKRLKSLGNILEINSEEHINNFLLAQKIISSVYESWVESPLGNGRKYLRDLLNYDFIFIQHGIIKDDLSNYINRINKNYKIIITSSNKEYQSILKYNYYYNSNNVILTGLPRYDDLRFKTNINSNEKIIAICPSWRKSINDAYDSRTHESIYSKSFISTNYYHFYNKLINDKNLIINMKKLNYSGIFCLHPSFSKQWTDFKQNERFIVLNKFNYHYIVSKASLLITDYSSIFFDFAYLKKPIIYTHFDYEEYRKNNYPEGYYNYIKYGFGPICFDINCTISEIISYIKNNCLLNKKYMKRIKKFFKYKDDKNSERLYNYLINNTVILYNINYIIIRFIIFIIIISILIAIKFNK